MHQSIARVVLCCARAYWSPSSVCCCACVFVCIWYKCCTIWLTGYVVNRYSAHPFVFVSVNGVLFIRMLPSLEKDGDKLHQYIGNSIFFLSRYLTKETTDISRLWYANGYHLIFAIRNDNNTVRVWYFDDDVYMCGGYSFHVEILCHSVLLLIRSESVSSRF